MVVEREGSFEIGGHGLYTKSWLVRHLSAIDLINQTDNTPLA